MFCMNERFIKKVKESGLSQYSLSNISGVPYATVNGFMTGKHCINSCAASTLSKLAVALNEDMEKLLDPYPVMDKVKGEHCGIKYQWHYNGKTTDVIIKEKDGDVVVNTGSVYKFPEDMKLYRLFAEAFVEDYLERKRLDKLAESYLNATYRPVAEKNANGDHPAT